MAVTQGHGNPDWTRDETILALNLYFACAGRMPGPADPRVVQLSATIRSLPIHAGTEKNAHFRNTAGVAFKLQNIRKVATGIGLGNVSKVDKEVWRDFGQAPDRVAVLAERILAQAGPAPEVTAERVAEVDPAEEFAEGRVLTAVHQVRERSRKVRAQLVESRRASDRLRCDACGDGPRLTDNSLDDAGFEAHHVLPLAHTGPRRTSSKDMALLCATCHRLLHRVIQARREWVSVADFSTMLRGRVVAEGEPATSRALPKVP